jgi:hypothetical protein
MTEVQERGLAARERDVAGALYAPVISAQLDQERGRALALEASAESVLRSAGIMLTLFTALLALLSPTHISLTTQLVVVIALAYWLLIVAGLLATAISIMGHRIEANGEISTAVLEGWLADWGSGATEQAALEIAELQISRLKLMRRGNVRKRWLTQVAVGAEMAGLAVLIASLGLVAVKQLGVT